jgi:hypothetical protein
VPALLMAGLYQALQWATGLTARERPDLFCYLMTLCTRLAYLVRSGRCSGWPPRAASSGRRVGPRGESRPGDGRTRLHPSRQ